MEPLILLIIVILTVVSVIFVYLKLKQRSIRKKHGAIIAEQRLPASNYLTYVPKREVSSYRPRWEEASTNLNLGDHSFDAEIKYEDEPIKRLSETYIPAAIDGLIAGIQPLRHLSEIDWNVINALDFSSKEDLSNYNDLSHFVSDHMVNLEQTDGWYTRLHGYVAEQVAASTVEAHGHHVEFPELSNQPGFDLIVDGQLWQVKAGADPQAILDHLDKHPDIPVFTTTDLASHFPNNPMVVPMPSLDHDQIKDSIHHTMNGIDSGHVTPHFHFPWITACLSGYREIDLLMSNKTDLDNALKNLALDVAGTGGGGLVGAKTGAWLGSIFGPVGTAVGALVGGVAGALAGRKVTNEIKRSAFQQALQKYNYAFQNVKREAEAKTAEEKQVFHRFIGEQQVEYDRELNQVEEYFKPLVISEKIKYQKSLNDFIAAFDGILSEIETELRIKKDEILSQIPRSHKIIRVIWPTKQDVFYDATEKWFDSRLEFLKKKKLKFQEFVTTIESDDQFKSRLDEIFSFSKENPFRNETYEQFLSKLDNEYITLCESIETLKRKARMVAEIKRKPHLDMIKNESLNTYRNLSEFLQTKVREIAPLKEKLKSEADKLGIQLGI